MRVLLTTMNAKYIHKSLSLRWLYVARDKRHETFIREFTIKDNLNHILEEIVKVNPDFIGFSTYIWNGEMVKQLTHMVRQALPNVKILLGGPEVSYQYQDYLTEDVDAISLGEGEITFWQYVNGMNNVQGIITHTWKNESLPKVDLSYLETLESPYLLDSDLKDMGKRYLYLETARGCPYQCKYCLASLDNRIRNFSLDYLFHQLDQLEKTDVQIIKFLDRTFNADKKRALQIAQRLLNFREDAVFEFEIMVDTLDEDLLELICNNPVKSRFRFEVGIQSFNKDTLTSVNRFQNLNRLTSNIHRLVESGAIVHADLIAGLPMEDLNSFKDTYQQLFELRVDEMQVGILKLLKGSKLREEMPKWGIEADTHTPYQIISNHWVSRSDIEQVENVAFATERLWNRNLIRQTLWNEFINGRFMFDFMEQIGYDISLLPRPFQPHQLFQIVNKYLIDEKSQLLLRNEYYYLFKQRPVRFVEFQMDKKEKNNAFMVLVNQNEVTQNDIRYSYFDYGYYQDRKVYSILLYNSDQRYPMRYFVSLEDEYLGKEDINEGHYDRH